MKNLLSLNIGKKILVGGSGLFLVIFVIVHLSGNFLLFVGQDAFNTYSHLLTRNKVILYGLEVFIILGLLTHVLVNLNLTLKNMKAKGKSYYKKKTLGKSNIFSSNMGITGSYIFIFLIVHIRTFKYGATEMVKISSFPDAWVKDLYTLVTTSFNNGLYTFFYCIAMLLLGGHLYHGFQSAFKSLGLYQTKWEKTLKAISILLGIFIGGGFMSIPLYFYFIA